jgi:hypothetical protein
MGATVEIPLKVLESVDTLDELEDWLTAQEWAWAKRYGGQGAERSTGIVLDTQGSQYAAGWFEGAATFGTQTLTVTGQRDAFVGKWDADGNFQQIRPGLQ